MEDLFGGISGGLTFDSSLSDSIDKSLSPAEYKHRMMGLIEPLLRQRFPNHIGKQKIKTHTDRITFACPYCGDSMQSDYKHRGNIILTGKFAGYYKCFNCGAFKSVDSFLSDYKIDPQLDLINYLSSTKGDFKKSSYGSYDISVLMDAQSIEGFAIEREELKKRFSLIEVAGTRVLSWLKGRLQFDEERFLYNSNHDYLVILNLTRKGNILGFQRRNFDKRSEKYNTYTLQKIYSEMEVEKEIPPEIEVLSQLYRVAELDFNLPITLFEGPLDSFLLRNSVANAGLQKGFPIEIPLRYWYDDDPQGRKKSLEKIEEHQPVFLWSRFRSQMGMPWRKKWDLNDVAIWFRENNRKTPIFDPYFSDDPLDSIDI